MDEIGGQAVSLRTPTGAQELDAAMPDAYRPGDHMSFPTPATLAHLATSNPITFALYVAATAGAITALYFGYRSLRRAATHRPKHRRSIATRACYGVFALALGVSLDTSYRFFGDRLHIDGTERIVLFTVIEAGFIACAVGMHQGAKSGTGPGPFRLVVWLECVFAAYAALVEAGPAAGLARVILGPISALIWLHLALGIEIRGHRTRNSTMWMRLTSEFRERFLSLFGLSNDARDAADKTRARAGRRLVRLSLVQHPAISSLHTRRVVRAVRMSGVAQNPAMRTAVISEIQFARHAQGLSVLEMPSPWVNTVADASVPAASNPSTPPAVAAPEMPSEVAHVKDANLVSISHSSERPGWLTEDMTAKDAMKAYLDRHPDTSGAVLTRWAKGWFEISDDYGRGVRREWLAGTAQAVGDE